jgi:hypothetical protein
MKTTVVNKLTTLCSVLIAATLALLPFHALLTVWAGSNFGQYDLFRVWIEGVLILLAVLVGLVIAGEERLRAVLRNDSLAWVCITYLVWQLGVGMWALQAGQVNSTALVDGLATDLRFPAFLLLCWLVALKRQWLAARWRELVGIPAAIVTAFGLLQAFVLPADILRHAGYGPQTIPPFETVDQKAAYVRVQSSLRGANPLGAYLLIIVAGLLTGLARTRKVWRIASVLFLAGALVVLGMTYSRSAYIGAVVTVAVAAWLLASGRRAQRWLLYGAAGCIVVTAGAFLAFRHDDRFQNTFFHTDEHSQALRSSNQDRATALSQGLRDVAEQPFGRGAGSAGPASAHNNHPARIAENYYLQIGQESGWLGLGLFLALNVMVAVRLWQRRSQQLATVLLASLAGISVINLVSHAWTDETLGLLWWGLAGIALSLPRGTRPPKAAKGHA